MKRKHWLWALVLSVLAAGLWTYHSRQARWRAEGRALWMEYLRGPLSGNLEALNEARPWLASSKAWGPSQRQALHAAAARMQDAAAQAQDWQLRADRHGAFEALSLAAQVHGAFAEAAQGWAALPATAGAARSAAFQFEDPIREPWGERLDLQKARAWEDFGQSQQDLLEGNALIYSWKEGFLNE